MAIPDTDILNLEILGVGGVCAFEGSGSA